MLTKEEVLKLKHECAMRILAVYINRISDRYDDTCRNIYHRYVVSALDVAELFVQECIDRSKNE
jgi:hypothetical protein